MKALFKSFSTLVISNKIILFFLAFQFSTSSISQPIIDWEVSLGGTDNDEPCEIFDREDGTLLIIGSTKSADLDINENKGGYDIWALLLNSNGDLLWEKSYGGTGDDYPRSAQKTNDGGYIIIGETGSSDGDIKSGNKGGRTDAWLLKLDYDGNLLWEKTYGGSDLDQGWSVAESSDGGYFLAVQTQSNDGDILINYGESDYWVLKVDSVGVIEWQKTYGGSNYDFPIKIIIASNGNIVLAGESSSDNGDIQTPFGLNDYWVLELDLQGNILSNRSYGGSASDFTSSIQEIENNEFILFGSSKSSDGDISNNNGDFDFSILHLDKFGDIIWEKNFGGTEYDFLNSVSKIPSGNYILGGHSASNDLDIGGNLGRADILLCEINDSGNMLWEQNYGGSNSESLRSFIVRSDGSIIVTGRTLSNDGDISKNNGKFDIWVMKLSRMLDYNNTIKKLSFDIFPNPTKDYLNITINEELSNWNVELINDDGRIIFKTKLKSNQIEINDIPAGQYLLNISNNKISGTKMVFVK